MMGSTARVNSVDANTTRPTILKTGGMVVAQFVKTCMVRDAQHRSQVYAGCACYGASFLAQGAGNIQRF
jgi:hypothetical protein